MNQTVFTMEDQFDEISKKVVRPFIERLREDPVLGRLTDEELFEAMTEGKRKTRIVDAGRSLPALKSP